MVLVGKGITFDTGGLSIKPAEAMVNMKRDMTGGAVVIADAWRRSPRSAARSGSPAWSPPPRTPIGGVVDAPRRRDPHYGGRTTEVTNTDAEGRLVMADALAYAVAELDPDALVDVATLTGAMKVALGPAHRRLLRQPRRPGRRARRGRGARPASRCGGCRWPTTTRTSSTSTVADADNAPGGPGAITAALFLQHFTGDVPWAHLDIASVGDAPSDRDEWTAGPTGFGSRALLHWLENDPLAGIR